MNLSVLLIDVFERKIHGLEEFLLRFCGHLEAKEGPTFVKNVFS